VLGDLKGRMAARTAAALLLVVFALAIEAGVASGAPRRADAAATGAAPFASSSSSALSSSKRPRARKRRRTRVVAWKLKGSGVTIAPGEARRVSGGAGSGTLVISLRRGAPQVRSGDPIVLKPFPAVPTGAVGIVKSVSRHGGKSIVTVRQAALSEVFSTLHVEASGYLGEAIAQSSATGARARTAGLGPLTPKFSCSGSAPSPNISVDLSQVRYTLDVKVPDFIQAFIGGPVKFGVGFNFPAAVSCSASLTIKVPLGETGMFLDIGPELSVHAGGAASAAFTWTPRMTFAFFRSRSGVGNSDTHEFSSSGHVEFGGSAEVGAGLALKVALTAFDKAGVEGTIGPSLDAKVETTGGQVCRVVDASADADLNAFAHLWFADWTFNLAHLTFWRDELSRSCGPAPPPPPAPVPPSPPPTPKPVSPTLVYDGYTAGNEFSGDTDFSEWEAATGHEARVSPELPTDLSNYRCVALDLNQVVERPEIESLRTYLAAGGTVVVLGEHEGPGFSSADLAFDEALEALGASISIDDDSLDEGTFDTSEIESSPLTADVGFLKYNWVSSLTASGGAEPLVLTADGLSTLVAAQHVGGGTVVVSGDSNIFSDNNEGAYEFDDNGQFVRDLCG
jgi:hypothetical protein